MNKAKQLYELQEVDLEIEQKTKALANARDLIGKNDDVMAARANLESARKNLSDLESRQKSADWEVDQLQAKIAHEEKKLYDGSVKNPRELMNLQHEIDLLREQQKDNEERLLTVMMEVDSAEQDVTGKSGELDVTESKWRESQRLLASEQAELETSLAELGQKRDSLVSQTDPECIITYQQVRLAKGGHAVAKVVQARCEGCRISLPMSDQQQARSGHQLVTCSNCGRILYMD
jgi:predicted  nucleic acid-binding Zn-ribbon protein